MKDSIRNILAITQLKGIGCKKAKSLIKTYGSIHNFFDCCFNHPKEISPNLSEHCQPEDIARAWAWAEKQINYCAENESNIITYFDDAFPYRLKRYDDCPIVLFTKGNMKLNAPKYIAMVGTRKMTSYGIWNIEQFIETISSYDVIMVSGLAYGVDTAVHKKCTELGIMNIGVMGTGLDQIYPATNARLVKKILKKGGIVTELGVESSPEAYHFPARNRIIAALSDAIVVVESKKRGGAMITAHIGFDYQKDIFAFPGRVNDDYSAGTNELIKRNKAQLISTAEDVLLAMGWKANHVPKSVQSQLFHDLTPIEKSILGKYTKNKAIHIEEILSELTYTHSEIATSLLQLELKGLIRPLPGSRYIIL